MSSISKTFRDVSIQTDLPGFPQITKAYDQYIEKCNMEYTERIQYVKEDVMRREHKLDKLLKDNSSDSNASLKILDWGGKLKD